MTKFSLRELNALMTVNMISCGDAIQLRSWKGALRIVQGINHIKFSGIPQASLAPMVGKNVYPRRGKARRRASSFGVDCAASRSEGSG